MFNVEFEEVTNQFCAEFDTVVHTGDATLGEKTITANGVYNASSDNLDGYSKVNVNVPTGGDTPVIESLSVTPTTSQQTYNDSDVDGYKPVVVNPIPPEYVVPTGTKNITQNGQGIDVAAFASANVNVPNSYSASDEGKVVDSGALIAQTAHADVTPTTSDQTIDTTTNNSIKVKGDADLVAANIKKDVEIFGVTGSYEGSGTSFGPMDYPVNITNNRSSGTISCIPIYYNSKLGMRTQNANITNGSTATFNNMLTDGSHIWFTLNNVTSVTYNGQSVDYLKDSASWRITLPANFDGTTPFVFTN